VDSAAAFVQKHGNTRWRIVIHSVTGVYALTSMAKQPCCGNAEVRAEVFPPLEATVLCIEAEKENYDA